MISIPVDKQGHFHFGVYSTMVTYFILNFFVAHLTALLIACGVGILIGIGKEVIWDKLLGRGNPETLDAVATASGAIFILVIFGFAGR